MHVRRISSFIRRGIHLCSLSNREKVLGVSVEFCHEPLGIGPRMKSERRHELQTNVLADWLGKHIESTKPYARMTVGAIGLLFVLAVAWLFLSNRKSTQQAAGWQDFYGAVERRSEPLLREVAQRHAGTEVGLWASYSLANFIYNDGAQQLFDDREQANELLLSAQSVYDDVVRQAKQPFLQQRAIFGLAQAFESRNDLLNAGKQYSRLAERWPDTALGKHAEQAVLRLRGQESFYDWFFDQQPKPSVDFFGGKTMEFGDFSEVGVTESDTNFLEGIEAGVTDSIAESGDAPASDATTPSAGDLDLNFDSSSLDTEADADSEPDDLGTGKGE